MRILAQIDDAYVPSRSDERFERTAQTLLLTVSSPSHAVNNRLHGTESRPLHNFLLVFENSGLLTPLILTPVSFRLLWYLHI